MNSNRARKLYSTFVLSTRGVFDFSKGKSGSPSRSNSLFTFVLAISYLPRYKIITRLDFIYFHCVFFFWLRYLEQTRWILFDVDDIPQKSLLFFFLYLILVYFFQIERAIKYSVKHTLVTFTCRMNNGLLSFGLLYIIGSCQRGPITRDPIYPIRALAKGAVECVSEMARPISFTCV
jgi:hypothetical protein